MNDRVESIAVALQNVAKMIGDTVPTDRLMMIAELLNKEIPDDENLVMAMDAVILRETRFPAPAKFLEYAGASLRARAQEALENVFSAIKVYGSTDPSNARRRLGEATWRTILSCGGWNHICLAENMNVEVFRSQFINSYVDRVPFLEASGETQREFLGPGSRMMKELAESKDINKVLSPGNSANETEEKL